MKITAQYLIRRIIFALFILWVAITINFLIPRLIGGDPATTIASQTALGSEEYANILKEQFGLSNPNLWFQYRKYIGELLNGNLGISFQSFPTPVVELVKDALPYTILIALSAVILSFLLGWIFAIFSAIKPGSKFDTWTLIVSFYFRSMPYFWVGMFLVIIFSFNLGWFPLGHAVSRNAYSFTGIGKVLDIIHHAILPITSLVLVTFAGRFLVMRNNMINALSEDYMILAKAKGLSKLEIIFKYGLRNALLPSFTGLMLSIGKVVGGVMLTEIVFSYPGIGQLMYQAILNNDYPVIQGTFLIVAVCVIVANFIADITYPFIDSRINLK